MKRDYTILALSLPFCFTLLVTYACFNEPKSKDIILPDNIVNVKAGEKLIVEIVNNRHIVLDYDQQPNVILPEEALEATEGDVMRVQSIKDGTLYFGYDVHYCTDPTCEYNGKVMHQRYFTSMEGYEEGTDGFLMELTHYMNPEWTKEECEDYVMSGVN